AALARVANPLTGLKSVELTLQRDAAQDVLLRLTLGYDANADSLLPLGKAALPLWSTGGPAEVRGVHDDEGGHLALVWEDKQTRYTLRLPHRQGRGPQLEVADRAEAGDLARRAEQVLAKDRAERRARFASKKPLTRLPRDLEKVN